MSEVHIVMSGHSSDRMIRAVFTRPDFAQLYIDNGCWHPGDDPGILEITVNTAVNGVGEALYKVGMYLRTGKAWCSALHVEVFDGPRKGFEYEKVDNCADGDGGFYYVHARSKEHAIKVADEYRRKAELDAHWRVSEPAPESRP